MTSGQGFHRVERDGGYAVGEGWAVEQCERVCCEMDSSISGEKVKWLIDWGGQVEYRGCKFGIPSEYECL